MNHLFTRYLDPKNDLAFKKVFGAEKHKKIPIDFLNAVLRLKGETRIVDLEFIDSRQPPEVEARKESIVDVLVRDQRGVKYIVEMQVAKVEGFEKRAQYYAAKTYCSHFGKGERYGELVKVVFLAITDFIMFPRKAHYKSNHIILDNKSLEHDLKDFSFTFVELPKFNKKLGQLRTTEDKWYYFLKHAPQKDEHHKTYDSLTQHSEIKEAYKILDSLNWSEGELQWYEKLIMNTADTQGMIEAGYNDGRRKGLSEGLLKGLLKGRTEEKLHIAKNLSAANMSIAQIMACTGLSEPAISQLRKQSKSKKRN